MRILSRLGIDVNPSVGSIQLADNGSLQIGTLGSEALYQHLGALGMTRLDQTPPLTLGAASNSPALTLARGTTNTAIALSGTQTIGAAGGPSSNIMLIATMDYQCLTAGGQQIDSSLTGSPSPAFTSHASSRAESGGDIDGQTHTVFGYWTNVAAGASWAATLAVQNGLGGPSIIINKTECMWAVIRNYS